MSTENPNPSITSTVESEATPQPIFKTYKLPCGAVLKLTKDEFEDFVEAMRLLQAQDAKLQIKTKAG